LVRLSVSDRAKLLAAHYIAARRDPDRARHPDVRPNPNLLAAAIARRDLGIWASQNDIVTARAE